MKVKVQRSKERGKLSLYGVQLLYFISFYFKALNGGIVMVNFFNDYINCAPNEIPKATLDQVAGKIFYC